MVKPSKKIVKACKKEGISIYKPVSQLKVECNVPSKKSSRRRRVSSRKKLSIRKRLRKRSFNKRKVSSRRKLSKRKRLRKKSSNKRKVSSRRKRLRKKSSKKIKRSTSEELTRDLVESLHSRRNKEKVKSKIKKYLKKPISSKKRKRMVKKYITTKKAPRSVAVKLDIKLQQPKMDNQQINQLMNRIDDLYSERIKDRKHMRKIATDFHEFLKETQNAHRFMKQFKSNNKLEMRRRSLPVRRRPRRRSRRRSRTRTNIRSYIPKNSINMYNLDRLCNYCEKRNPQTITMPSVSQQLPMELEQSIRDLSNQVKEYKNIHNKLITNQPNISTLNSLNRKIQKLEYNNKKWENLEEKLMNFIMWQRSVMDLQSHKSEKFKEEIHYIVLDIMKVFKIQKQLLAEQENIVKGLAQKKPESYNQLQPWSQKLHQVIAEKDKLIEQLTAAILKLKQVPNETNQAQYEQMQNILGKGYQQRMPYYGKYGNFNPMQVSNELKSREYEELKNSIDRLTNAVLSKPQVTTADVRSAINEAKADNVVTKQELASIRALLNQVTQNAVDNNRSRLEEEKLIENDATMRTLLETGRDRNNILKLQDEVMNMELDNQKSNRPRPPPPKKETGVDALIKSMNIGTGTDFTVSGLMDFLIKMKLLKNLGIDVGLDNTTTNPGLESRLNILEKQLAECLASKATTNTNTIGDTNIQLDALKDWMRQHPNSSPDQVQQALKSIMEPLVQHVQGRQVQNEQIANALAGIKGALEQNSQQRLTPDQLAQLQTGINQAKGTIDEILRKVVDSQGRAQRVEDRLDEINRELKRQDISAQEKSDLLREREENLRKLGEITAESTELKSQLTTAREELEEARKQIDSLSTVSSKYEALEQFVKDKNIPGVDTPEKYIEFLEKALDKLRNLFPGMSDTQIVTELDKMRNTITRLQTPNTDPAKNLLKLQTIINLIKPLFPGVSNEKLPEAIKESLEKCKEVERKLNTNISELKNKLQEKDLRITKLIKEIDQLKTQCQTTQGNCDAIEAELTQKKEEYDVLEEQLGDIDKLLGTTDAVARLRRINQLIQIENNYNQNSNLLQTLSSFSGGTNNVVNYLDAVGRLLKKLGNPTADDFGKFVDALPQNPQQIIQDLADARDENTRLSNELKELQTKYTDLEKLKTACDTALGECNKDMELIKDILQQQLNLTDTQVTQPAEIEAAIQAIKIPAQMQPAPVVSTQPLMPQIPTTPGINRPCTQADFDTIQAAKTAIDNGVSAVKQIMGRFTKNDIINNVAINSIRHVPTRQTIKDGIENGTYTDDLENVLEPFLNKLNGVGQLKLGDECDQIIMDINANTSTIQTANQIADDYENAVGVGRIYVRFLGKTSKARNKVPVVKKVGAEVEFMNCEYPLVSTPGDNNYNNTKFGPFTNVFESSTSNTQLYKDTIKSLVDRMATEGFNNVTLAYGQSGSGKTYSLLGDTKSGTLGLLQESLNQLLTQKQGLQSISLRSAQIYNGNVFDALADYNGVTTVNGSVLVKKNIFTARGDPTSIANKKFEYLSEDIAGNLQKGGGPFSALIKINVRADKKQSSRPATLKKLADVEPTDIPVAGRNSNDSAISLTEALKEYASNNGTMKSINDINDFNRAYSIISSNRPTRATLLNPDSSRSHLFIFFDLNYTDGTSTTLTFVDLAGNEKFWADKVKGSTSANEGKTIVRELVVLRKLFQAYADGRLIKDFYGDNSDKIDDIDSIRTKGNKSVQRDFWPILQHCSQYKGTVNNYTSIMKKFKCLWEPFGVGDPIISRRDGDTFAIYNLLDSVIHFYEPQGDNVTKVQMLLCMHARRGNGKLAGSDESTICTTTLSTLKTGQILSGKEIFTSTVSSSNNSTQLKLAKEAIWNTWVSKNGPNKINYDPTQLIYYNTILLNYKDMINDNNISVDNFQTEVDALTQDTKLPTTQFTFGRRRRRRRSGKRTKNRRSYRKLAETRRTRKKGRSKRKVRKRSRKK